MDDQPKSASELFLDACLYAPLGFMLEARTLLPTLAERGRKHVGLAKVVGQFAVGRLERELGPWQVETERWLTTLLVPLGLASNPRPELEAVDDEPATQPGDADAEPDAIPLASELPIPGFDELAASQVIPRLAGMTPTELAAVRTYEQAHRARRTILNRIEQLTSGA